MKRGEGYSDRLIFVKVSVKTVDVVLVQVCMPTTNHDDEIENLYEENSEILHQERKGHVNAKVMRDFNSIVGGGSTDKVVGPFGLGKRNEGCKMLIDFCKHHDVVLMNTWFKKRKTKLYTWKSAGDRKQYQIDYILVKQR